MAESPGVSQIEEKTENTQRDKCIFCKIADGKESTELLHEDSELVVFRDIHPWADHHYLVVTKEHIPNPKVLIPSQVDLVERMVTVGTEILEKKGGVVSDSRLGFHWPPFNTISHLHLHVLAPVSRFPMLTRVVFKPGIWFVLAETVITKLKLK